MRPLSRLGLLLAFAATLVFGTTIHITPAAAALTVYDIPLLTNVQRHLAATPGGYFPLMVHVKSRAAEHPLRPDVFGYK